MKSPEIPRRIKEGLNNLKKWTPARWLVVAGIIGMAAGLGDTLYLHYKINSEVNSRYPIPSSAEENQQKIQYKSQLEQPVPLGTNLLASGFALIVIGAVIDARKSNNKEGK